MAKMGHPGSAAKRFCFVLLQAGNYGIVTQEKMERAVTPDVVRVTLRGTGVGPPEDLQ